ncbi:hypothetical protein [Streptomyces demainii]|uniref:PE-PGRS family protein n=1 Tax=Streptomyces demainii TaxID=588122 RepID=A0ABT9KK57_9ACTN|nr:hypothetical protein [Streptomyces demainii]MDP9608818.1 hypothetical protein [Streptomyces demainii]
MAQEKWTPDLLKTPEDRAIHLAQRRAQIEPIIDDLRRLAREVAADLKERGALEGDMPFQARARAWSTGRPMFQAVDDLEAAITHLVAFGARYERSYEELPEKRARKAAEKQRVKELKASAGAPQLEQQRTDTAPQADPSGLFDHLTKGA